MAFAPDYVSLVLNDIFEDAKAQFLSPLMAIHHAHLVMLVEQGIVSPADGRAIAAALGSIERLLEYGESPRLQLVDRGLRLEEPVR